LKRQLAGALKMLLKRAAKPGSRGRVFLCLQAKDVRS